MYHALGLLPPDSDFTLEAAAQRLKAHFPQARVERSGNEVNLSEGEWDYRIVFQKGPDVLEESEGLAGRIAGLDDDATMRSCDRRVELSCETPDPFMEYFDKHFQVLDVIRTFAGAILVDPKEPSLI
jgi:hypothetical protein